MSDGHKFTEEEMLNLFAAITGADPQAEQKDAPKPPPQPPKAAPPKMKPFTYTPPTALPGSDLVPPSSIARSPAESPPSDKQEELSKKADPSVWVPKKAEVPVDLPSGKTESPQEEPPPSAEAEQESKAQVPTMEPAAPVEPKVAPVHEIHDVKEPESFLPSPPPPMEAPPIVLEEETPEAEAPPAPAPGEEGLSKQQIEQVVELGHQFEIGRARMEQVLTPFIGQKVTRKMLSWSRDRVQKTRPILKNVHWSPAGDLLDNGAIEVDRLARNLEYFRGQDVVALTKAAFLELLDMRLSAVEQGLGASLRQAVDREIRRLRGFLT